VSRRNVELKARDPDPEATLAACLALGAEDRGVLEQRDTYFAVASGRLKLREERPGGAQLVQYERADEPGARLSRYRVVEVPDGAALAEALGAALGVAGVVAKRRRLLLWQGVRIHLDDVDGLGRFVELEAVGPPESDLTREHELVARLRDELRITDDRLVERGSADQHLG
jgi:adenylate cyclase class 2